MNLQIFYKPCKFVFSSLGVFFPFALCLRSYPFGIHPFQFASDLSWFPMNHYEEDTRKSLTPLVLQKYKTSSGFWFLVLKIASYLINC